MNDKIYSTNFKGHEIKDKPILTPFTYLLLTNATYMGTFNCG